MLTVCRFPSSAWLVEGHYRGGVLAGCDSVAAGYSVGGRQVWTAGLDFVWVDYHDYRVDHSVFLAEWYGWPTFCCTD